MVRKNYNSSLDPELEKNIYDEEDIDMIEIDNSLLHPNFETSDIHQNRIIGGKKELTINERIATQAEFTSIVSRRATDAYPGEMIPNELQVMSSRIMRSFPEKDLLCIHAEVGTGKTFAGASLFIPYIKRSKEMEALAGELHVPIPKCFFMGPWSSISEMERTLL